MVRRKYLAPLICAALLWLTVLNLSCRNETFGISSENPKHSEKQEGNIRNVDFKTFRYPWYPSYLESPQGSKEVFLRDGKFEAKGDQESGLRYLILELDDVSYADLLNNGRDQAIVYIRGVSVINRFVGCFFIYAFEDGGPKLLWHHETGDRADGGLRKMEVEDRSLIIEQYTLDGGEGLCCPKKFVRRYFQWDGTKFGETTSQTLPNDDKK